MIGDDDDDDDDDDDVIKLVVRVVSDVNKTKFLRPKSRPK